MRGEYRVEILPSARRELERLQRPLSTRVAEAIDRLSTDPRPRGCGKLTDTDSDYRIRIGDYRILYEVIDDKKLVSVYRIRHRSRAYG